jgi:Mrp family chromosome partitioning ATPase
MGDDADAAAPPPVVAAPAAPHRASEVVARDREDRIVPEPSVAPPAEVPAPAAATIEAPAVERPAGEPAFEPLTAEHPAVERTVVERTAVTAGTTDRLASLLRQVGEAGRRVTVVGALRNIGTTSAAVALARALAHDARVVLVDLALNAPNIAAMSSDPGAPGIAELMRGTASFRHIITRDRGSRVHLVAAGRTPADLSSILRSERLTIAISALARTYDQLVAPGLSEEATKLARDRLVAAGFNDLALFTEVPPRPDSDSGPSTQAA